jgi:hypothetical protein
MPGAEPYVPAEQGTQEGRLPKFAPLDFQVPAGQYTQSLGDELPRALVVPAGQSVKFVAADGQNASLGQTRQAFGGREGQ